jgi:hypothetical protein
MSQLQKVLTGRQVGRHAGRLVCRQRDTFYVRLYRFWRDRKERKRGEIEGRDRGER